jgi:hypothetical protein
LEAARGSGLGLEGYSTARRISAQRLVTTLRYAQRHTLRTLSQSTTATAQAATPLMLSWGVGRILLSASAHGGAGRSPLVTPGSGSSAAQLNLVVELEGQQLGGTTGSPAAASPARAQPPRNLHSNAAMQLYCYTALQHSPSQPLNRQQHQHNRTTNGNSNNSEPYQGSPSHAPIGERTL